MGSYRVCYNPVPVGPRKQNVLFKSEELKWAKYQKNNTKGAIIFYVYIALK